MKKFLSGSSLYELTSYAKSRQIPAFRAKQIYSWLYDHAVCEPEKMKNLPAALRLMLQEDFYAPGSRIAERVNAADGVEKLMLQLYDGECIEMVILPAADGRITFCLSTQVGCPVKCRFCASGKHGLVRNLKAGEMLEEFALGISCAGRPDNLVFMGIGEGLLNFEELAKTLAVLSGEFNFAPRRITVSTSGYVPGMKQFATLKKEYNLAVSLHAVDDETRAKLIPPHLRYPVKEILSAADEIREANGRQYTLEYTLIAGINDSLEAAEKLGRIAVSHHAKVNLIPYNETGNEFCRPDKNIIAEFEQKVASTGARVTCRVERGSKKTAACGQLRVMRMQKKEEGL